MAPARGFMRGFGRRKIAWAWLSSQQRRLDGEQTAGSNAPTQSVSSSGVLQAPFGTLARLKSRIGVQNISIAGAPSQVQQMKEKIYTMATNAGDESELNFAHPDMKLNLGDSKGLLQRIAAEINDLKKELHEFEARYNKHVRPLLVSACLTAPCGINDPWMVFLHRQTFEIANQNPSYLSSFDIMQYEYVCKDSEWERFVKHLIDRRVYPIDDMGATFSTIETLMYDHGLKQPDDGTDDTFFKGECDASYDPKTHIANLSYIIWKDNMIFAAGVYPDIKCSSPTEAEIYAALALLYQAEKLQCRKLLVCSDSRTVTGILTGERPIDMKHEHCHLYLKLRLMRRRFDRLVVSWKARELMVFADQLAKEEKSVKLPHRDSSNAMKLAWSKWGGHLKGLPIYRIERSSSTTKAIKKFGKVVLNDAFGVDGKSIHCVHVEEDCKLQCFWTLIHSLKPSEVKVILKNTGDKFVSLKTQLSAVIGEDDEEEFARITSTSDVVLSIPTHKLFNSSVQSKLLVVVLDHAVPKHVYYQKGAFHVVFISSTDQNPEDIPELNALGFVYFHGVRFPLNRDEEEGKKQG
ncbi:uncharacterized protein LOC100827929 isoform X1 [Brachypodium distachyon]|uniref:uncharacterized protein LOC100827929 isoform X1 n=1 Tax=Brachypodium distachyon TaxID=15368 RepID=UPI000D0E3344|nr:uncharacterized protein LOC100827929 isoform X1 [Brachypodium distachyon]|eukprot:XP_024310511.1 uncharacterized protein LOC100827929 isoform X1 [Brachypodium distachyon]